MKHMEKSNNAQHRAGTQETLFVKIGAVILQVTTELFSWIVRTQEF